MDTRCAHRDARRMLVVAVRFLLVIWLACIRAPHATGNRNGEQHLIRHACRCRAVEYCIGSSTSSMMLFHTVSTTPPPETKDEESLLRALQVSFRYSAPKKWMPLHYCRSGHRTSGTSACRRSPLLNYKVIPGHDLANALSSTKICLHYMLLAGTSECLRMVFE